MKVEKQDKIKVEYEGKLESGEVFDSTERHQGEPLEFIVGVGMMIPGFDSAVIDMNEGEEKIVVIESKDAYGEPNPAYVQKIPKANFPMDIEEGMQIGIPTPMGQIPATIKTITEEFVDIDLNHPLAGKKLTFKIKVVGVEKGPFELPVHEHECSCGECNEDECEGECDCEDENCECEGECDCGDEECSCCKDSEED